ncbi:hypothetical protein GpartN1_g1059.t1 [Galdieria partita]|uniref:Uncharacterized protein n=1 Tax=Galdieria partita TaxID=83374 RepID=A0A9C7PRE7_9RHOD|nr:hypothetical protein GpartN1_g1059.t1 [Galdieria partita]
MQSKRLYSPSNELHEEDKNPFLFEPFLHDYDLDNFHGLTFTQEEYPTDNRETLRQPSMKKRESSFFQQPNETTSSIHSSLYFDSMIGTTNFQCYDIESGQIDWRTNSILGPEEGWSPYDQGLVDTSLLPCTGNDIFRECPHMEKAEEDPGGKTSESEPSWDSLETKTTPEKQRKSSEARQGIGGVEQSSSDGGNQQYPAFPSGRLDVMEKRACQDSNFPQRAIRPSPLTISSTISAPGQGVEDKLVEHGTVTLPSSSSRDYSFQSWVLSPRHKQHTLSGSPVRISPTTLPSVTPRDETDMLLPNESSSLEGYCPCCGNVMENFQHDQRLKRLEVEYQNLFCKVSKLQNSLLSILKKTSLPSETPIKPD